MLNIILGLLVIILIMVLILSLLDGKSKNYQIETLRQINEELYIELEKVKGE